MKRPVIGVSGPDRGGLAAWLFTKRAVVKAGGVALRIRPGKPVDTAKLDGLILGGGADIDPQYYGERREADRLSGYPNHRPFSRKLLELLVYPVLFVLRKLLSTKQYGRIDPARDELENRLIGKALERQIPILGICRGAQLLNIYFGGTLYQNLRQFYQEVPRYHTVLPKNSITITRDTLLARIVNGETGRINALHYQAIKELGEGFRVAAREENGIIQAVENSKHPFMLGVQWHPEYLPLSSEQQKIFDAFVEHAASLERENYCLT